VTRAGRGSLISKKTTEPPAQDPNEPEDVAGLQRELAVVRDKLEAAEWALAHIGSATKPLEDRLKRLVSEAVTEAQRIRTEARTQVEALIAEAEQLKDFARQGAEASAEQARQEVVDKAQAMLDNASRLQAAAEEQAAHHLRAAQARYQEVKTRAVDLQRTTEQALNEAIERKNEVDRQVAEARERAASIIRLAQGEAEARSNELIELARKQLHQAQQEAEQIIRRAEQVARNVSHPR
jgi:vacuolar-type H+-ATPase subunit H